MRSCLTSLSGQLAEALEDLGYGCCVNADILVDILQHSSIIDERSVAHALAMMARTHSGLPESLVPFSFLSSGENDSVRKFGESMDLPASGATTWNINVFVQALQTVAPGLKWPEVIRCLDNKSMQWIDSAGLQLIYNIFKSACVEPFPIQFIFGRWRNSFGQLHLIKAMLSGPVEIQSLLQDVPRRVPDSLDVWGSIDLVETLLRLSDVEGYDEVAPLFHAPLGECPEILLLALAESRPSWGPLHGEMLSALLEGLLNTSFPDSLPVLHRLWVCNMAVLVQGLVQMYRSNGTVDSLRRILEITQELGPSALLEVLATKQNYTFVCDLAVVAAQNHAIPLANWMARAVSEGGDDFALACVTFLRARLYGGVPSRSGFPPLPPDVAATMLQSLQKCKFGAAMAEISKLTRDAQGRLLGGAPPMQGMPMSGNPTSAPALVNAPAGNGSGVLGPGENQDAASQQTAQQQNPTLFPPDIEEEANSHFQRIYTSEMQIDGVIQMLKGFKLSQSQREQEVFACMIHNLFDEYRFFPR